MAEGAGVRGVVHPQVTLNLLTKAGSIDDVSAYP
jgi:hypothetical protein